MRQTRIYEGRAFVTATMFEVFEDGTDDATVLVALDRVKASVKASAKGKVVTGRRRPLASRSANHARDGSFKAAHGTKSTNRTVHAIGRAATNDHRQRRSAEGRRRNRMTETFCV